MQKPARCLFLEDHASEAGRIVVFSPSLDAVGFVLNFGFLLFFSSSRSVIDGRDTLNWRRWVSHCARSQARALPMKTESKKMRPSSKISFFKTGQLFLLRGHRLTVQIELFPPSISDYNKKIAPCFFSLPVN